MIRARPLGSSLGLAISLAFLAPAQAENNTQTLAIGVLAHDRGPASDHHEDGVDLNLEWKFSPLDLPGSPRPHLGATLNFQGDTSIVYAGLNLRVLESAPWLVDALLGAAVHDGPLHKDPAGCEQFSDCGFGTRFLPHFGLEIGYRIGAGASLSLFFDHLSHNRESLIRWALTTLPLLTFGILCWLN